MRQSAEVAVGGSETVVQARLFPIFAIMLVAALCICLFDLADARKFMGDIDDQMRELQIRRFLFGGAGWWDLHLPAIALPEPYISPWSRLVDAPYLAITYLLAPIYGKEAALTISFNVWPLMMLAIFCLQCAVIFRRMGLSASLIGYLSLMTTALAMVFALWEFVPGRIDHHNIQILALTTILCGLARWDRFGGWLVGVGTLISVAISLEGLPFVAIIFGSLVLAMIGHAAGAAVMLRHASMAMVLCALPLAYGLLGPEGILSTQCDAFSAPYIVLLAGFSGVLWLVSSCLPNANRLALVISLGLPSAILLVAFAVLFPQCLSGPYWMIDPVSKSYWLQRISQEHSALYFVAQGQSAILVLAVILALILTCASAFIASQQKSGWVGILIILIVGWVGLILTLVLNRYIRFAFAFAPLLVPIAIQFLQDRDPSRTALLLRRAVLGCAVFYIVLAMLVVRVTPARDAKFDAADYMAYNACEDGDFSVLKSVSPGRIAAPQGMGITLVETLPVGFSVAAVPFHRASPGMRRMFDAFLTEDADTRRAALSPFDYVAACRFPLKTDMGNAPLYDALSAGGDWPGLNRIPTGVDNPFQLFLIDHAALK